jgi:hypothetical protein
LLTRQGRGVDLSEDIDRVDSFRALNCSKAAAAMSGNLIES